MITFICDSALNKTFILQCTALFSCDDMPRILNKLYLKKMIILFCLSFFITISNYLVTFNLFKQKLSYSDRRNEAKGTRDFNQRSRIKIIFYFEMNVSEI